MPEILPSAALTETLVASAPRSIPFRSSGKTEAASADADADAQA
jgi:hypothetical protein